MLRPEECALIRAYEPRGAHEHAMLVQLPEFYSDDPSAGRLRSIAQDGRAGDRGGETRDGARGRSRLVSRSKQDTHETQVPVSVPA